MKMKYNDGQVGAYLLVLGNDVTEEAGLYLAIVALLLEGNTVHLTGLDLRWDVVRVHLS